MSFVTVSLLMLAGLGVVAAIATRFDKGDDQIVKGHDCSTCTSADDGSCQLHCLMEEKKRREGNKMEVEEF